MAFHSAQGPQLGLPQMIQSRPQFGYVGALLVWLFAYVQYAGFNVFNTILAGQSMADRARPDKLWVVIVTVLALVVALVGYDFIHRAEQGLTYVLLVIFGVFTIALFPCTTRRARSTSATSSRRRSSASSAWSPATRSAGRSTSRTTRATCRRTSPCARRSGGRTGARRSAPSG